MARKSRERLAIERKMAELEHQATINRRDAEDSIAMAEESETALAFLQGVLDAAADKVYDSPEETGEQGNAETT